MAQIAEKKGGPYTKNNQQRRRAEVYRLHFEYGYSASKISEMMRVNRNTINSDIKHEYEKMSKEFSEFNTGAFMIKQLNRLESQRTRLLEDLDSQIEMCDKLLIEKLVFDIEQKMIQFSSKIIPRQNSVDEKRTIISEEKISHVTRDVIKNVGLDAAKMIQKEILFRIISNEKCDMSMANQIYDKMSDLGLTLCTDDYGNSFNLLQFGYLRDFIKIDDKQDDVAKIIRNETTSRVNKSIKKEEFQKKYGHESQWSDEVWDEFDEAVDTMNTQSSD